MQADPAINASHHHVLPYLLHIIDTAAKEPEITSLFLIMGTLEAAKAWCDRAISKKMGREPVSVVETVTKEPEQALTAGQCARLSGWRRRAAPGDRAGFSPRWFYDHADELAFRIGGRGRTPVRFSSRGFRAWLAAR